MEWERGREVKQNEKEADQRVKMKENGEGEEMKEWKKSEINKGNEKR